MSVEQRLGPIRQWMSAAEIAALIVESTSAVPMLRNVTVAIVRRYTPDHDGCNWIAKHSPVPVEHAIEAERLITGIVRNAQRRLNLLDAR
jgi:hypothetical protein